MALATIEMRFKSVSAREAAGLNSKTCARARLAARGARPAAGLFFQTTTNAINTGLGGNSFRVEGVGTIDTKAVTFHCEGLGFDCGEDARRPTRQRRHGGVPGAPPPPPPPPHRYPAPAAAASPAGAASPRAALAAPQVDSYFGRGFEAHVRVQNWKPGTHVGLQWPGRTIRPVAPRAATVLKTESLGWGSVTIFTP